MKTQILAKWGLGLLLAALPLASGCNKGTAQSVPDNNQAVQSATVLGTNAPIEDATNAAPADEKPAVISDENPLPPQINPSAPTASIIKMAQAGVDESVMLAFISNSLSLFSLNSDDIIYLRDIGVTDPVITAMIQHDQQMKAMDQEQLAAVSAAQAQPDTNYYEQPAPTQTEETAAVSPPPQNITYNYFYDSLAPYGSWFYVGGFGWCWQPTVVVVNTGWQPYCNNGRWIYTSCGWYWYSNYSWGWAPFHYGRWYRHPRWGWCWVPGKNWGPAWVSWRYSNKYCGWAPLPPGAHYSAGVGITFYNRRVGAHFGFGLSQDSYVFVPVNRFYDRDPNHYRVPHDLVGTAYRHTTVQNVFTQRNRTVFNRGIEPRTITTATRTPIHEVAIRNVTAPRSQSGRIDRLEPGGRTLAVYHPPLHERAPEANRAFTRSVAQGPRAVGHHFESQPGNQPIQPVVQTRSPVPTLAESGHSQQPLLGNPPSQPTSTRTVTRGTIVMPAPDSRSQPVPLNSVRSTTPTMNQAPVRSQVPAIHMQGTTVNNSPVRPVTPPASSRNIIMRGSGNQFQPAPRTSVQSPPTMNRAPARPQIQPVRPQAPTMNRQSVQPIRPANSPRASASRPAWNQPRTFNSTPAPRTQTIAPRTTAPAPSMNEAVRAPAPQQPVIRPQAPAFSPRQGSQISQSRSARAPHVSTPRVNNAPAARSFQPQSAPAQRANSVSAPRFQPNNGGGARGRR